MPVLHEQGKHAMIIFANPKSQYEAHKDAINQAIQRVLNSGSYVLGQEVEEFERAFAEWHGSAHCVGVASGTDALHLALRALGVGRGDEVITVSHSATATATAVVMAGAVPVFVDIDSGSLTMLPEAFEKAITLKTKAVIPVHMYGHPADMPAIMHIARKRGIPVIEDCAQAHGARLNGQRAGTFGDMACFSFYPTKNLGAIGDGGAVATSRGDLAEKVALMRQYGWAERYVSSGYGVNSRLDPLQAAILSAKLPFLDEDNASRRRLAVRYDDGLAGLGLKLPSVGKDSEPVYHLYVVRLDRRDSLAIFLRDHGIGTAVHYPVPIHKQPYFAKAGIVLPQTEAAADTVLSLPMYPELAESAVDIICQTIHGWIAERG